MKSIQFLFGTYSLLLVFYLGLVHSTCVLESDFGFKINCAFKKSGLFRVRNLGGVKAHASIGFSLGDELGFEQSLTNLDPSRRRSVNVKNGVPPNIITDSTTRPAAKQEKRGKQNRIMMRPMPPASRPNQAAMDKLTTLHRRVSSTMQPIVVSSGPTVETPTSLTRANPTVTMAKPLPMGVPPFRPLPPKEETLKVLPIPSATKKSFSPLQIPQSKGPGPMYQSENYPHVSHEHVSKMVSQMTASHVGHVAQPLIRITPTPIIVNTPKLYSVPTTLNPFVPMPIGGSPNQGLTIIPAPMLKESMQPQVSTKISNYVGHKKLAIQQVNPISNFVDPVPHQVHDLASLYPAYNTKKVDDYNSISGYGDDTTLKFNKDDINSKIAEIAKAGNISMEAVEAAIALRQQQLLSKYANIPMPSTTTTTTTTTTTEEPVVYQAEPEPEVAPTVPQKPKRQPTAGKVMNAPREYYPVGYEKNFDDHFQSKVDLPETMFHCGDQKYFPGLYGDESLGCMVFHVCALTDDGLVMKSFLCPESTLFDQTILKCNWWFYVDCKNTRKLYDTNIPVSKSYQLMKALTFFSSYKKDGVEGQTATNPEDIDGIKQAISILENQETPSLSNKEQGGIEIVTPQPLIDERNNHRVTNNNESSPIYRANRNFNVSSSANSRRMSARRKAPEQQSQNSEFKLVTVNAGLNFKNDNRSSSSIEVNSREQGTNDSSAERKHRRRMTLRKENATSSVVTVSPITSTTSKIINTPTPTIEITQTEIHSINELSNAEVKQEKLTDELENAKQIDASIIKEAENSPPVKRFYRSSAEKIDAKELVMSKDKKVHIVRPTPTARLVGEFQTPSATIAKLDEAVLGSSYKVRAKKDTITIVNPQRHEHRSSMDRHRT